MKISIIIGIVVVVILVIGGIILATNMKSPAAPGTGNSGGTGAHTYNIDISNFAFSPVSLNVKVGDTVVWTNNQAGVPHTVTSDSGSELASGTLQTGQTFSHTFSSAGTFNYHCTIHPMMKASVIVS